ncbi:MAG: c-type cytochrome [Magnetococcales bacterium]|nr:c-type cytochrome [Magnetococcales bacterium]
MIPIRTVTLLACFWPFLPIHAESDPPATPFRRFLTVPAPSKSLVESWKNQSRGEREAALHLVGNVANGLRVYLESCSNKCHLPHGQGSINGEYPQIAGQLREVTIKQLADIRAKNRDNPTMYRFALPSEIGGVQNMADVAAYIETMPMTLDTGKGPGTELELGRRIHDRDCAICHGANGEGKAEQYYPLIQGQHYEYMVRQYQWIRDGRRRNAHPMMVEQIQGYSQRDIAAVMDFVSRQVPNAAKLKGSAPSTPPPSPVSTPGDDPRKDDLL